MVLIKSFGGSESNDQDCGVRIYLVVLGRLCRCGTTRNYDAQEKPLFKTLNRYASMGSRSELLHTVGLNYRYSHFPPNGDFNPPRLIERFVTELNDRSQYLHPRL